MHIYTYIVPFYFQLFNFLSFMFNGRMDMIDMMDRWSDGKVDGTHMGRWES